jgi:AP endonuclease-1
MTEAAAASASSSAAASSSNSVVQSVPSDLLGTGMPAAHHAEELPSVMDDADMQTSTQELIVSQETSILVEDEEETMIVETTKTKIVRKRSVKSKEPLKYDANRYHPQALVSKYYVGAHVSTAGGVSKAIENAALIGARAVALDLKSKRKWQNPPLQDEEAQAFKDAMARFRMQPEQILPHGSYLMNLGSPNKEVYEKSRVNFLDELQRCRAMGLHALNWHPGSTCGEITKEECMNKIADSINEVHSKTVDPSNPHGGVICVIENMAGQGGVIGGKFEEIAYIIERVTDKKRVGVCIDTCHAFAAGYDLTTEDKVKVMLKEFDSVVGLQYLRGLHLNDSKGALGCKKDRHENIGEGHIGLAGFRALMNSPECRHVPMILETPMPIDPKDAVAKYAREVAMLYEMEAGALKDTRAPDQKQPAYTPPSPAEIAQAKEQQKEKQAKLKERKKRQREEEEAELGMEGEEEQSATQDINVDIEDGVDEAEEDEKPKPAKRKLSVKREKSATTRKAASSSSSDAAASSPDTAAVPNSIFHNDASADADEERPAESAPKKLKRQNSGRKKSSVEHAAE